PSRAAGASSLSSPDRILPCFRGGKLDLYRCSTGFCGSDVDHAVVQLEDLAQDGEAEAGAARFGGEERIDDAHELRLADGTARVRELDDDAIDRGARGDV